MSQQINDNFQLLAGLPIDDRTRKSTIAERDAIASSRRYQGLPCFVEQTQTLYMLFGGITNANWVGIAGDNTSNALETVIDGFYVLLAGKTTPLDWEINDKFRGWIGNRYLVGTILALPVSLPSDIDDPAKVELAFDSDGFAPALSEQLDFEANGIDNFIDIGTTQRVRSFFYSSVLQIKDDWSQTDNIITFTFTPDAGAGIKNLSFI